MTLQSYTHFIFAHMRDFLRHLQCKSLIWAYKKIISWLGWWIRDSSGSGLGAIALGLCPRRITSQPLTSGWINKLHIQIETTNDTRQ